MSHQTILGSTGIIGQELGKALSAQYSPKLRLVSRNPKALHPEDELLSADLLDAAAAKKAVAGTDIAYLTAGLPYRSEVWLRDWPILLKNVVAACQEAGCKLVYFDNTYAYPQDISLQTENTPLTAEGKKGQAKAQAVCIVLQAIKEGMPALIARAPEFYGPGKTKSITHNLVFERVEAGKSPNVFLSADKQRSLIYTPDAAKAVALLGNTSDAYGQTWHLPCDDDRPTYREFIQLIEKASGRELSIGVLRKFMIRIAALFNKDIRETLELLPRYAIDNIFDSSKFKRRFPSFEVTSYEAGIREILAEKDLLA